MSLLKSKEFPAWLLLSDSDILPQRDFLFNNSARYGGLFC